MKKTILFISLLGLSFSIPAQHVSSISYSCEMNIPPYQRPDFTLIRQRFEGVSPDDLSEALTLSKELHEFYGKLVELVNQQILTYYYADTTVILERKLDKESEDEYIVIHPQKGRKTIYYTNKDGSVNCETSKIFNRYTPWEVTFEIDTLLSDRKMILGYDCFKVIVLEKRKNLSEPVSRITPINGKRYEMYVTDKLSLPADIVCGAWEPKIRFSALEIKSFDPQNPNYYEVFRAIEVKKGLNDKTIEFPQKFESKRIRF